MHARRQIGCQRSADALALTLTQIGAGLENLVPHRHGIALCQRLHDVAGKGAAATAQLEKHRVLTQRPQYRRNRLRHALREQRPEFRRRDEIAILAELGCPGAVITQARRVQGQLHVARKRNRAAGGDLGSDVPRENRAVCQRMRFGRGKRICVHALFLLGVGRGTRRGGARSGNHATRRRLIGIA